MLFGGCFIVTEALSMLCVCHDAVMITHSRHTFPVHWHVSATFDHRHAPDTITIPSDERHGVWHQSSVLQALCEGNPPVTGGFPSQRASNTESVSMSWRHNVLTACCRWFSRTRLFKSRYWIDFANGIDTRPAVGATKPSPSVCNYLSFRNCGNTA